jgi:glycosyltransferase involved in cell wall biosynthesis
MIYALARRFAGRATSTYRTGNAYSAGYVMSAQEGTGTFGHCEEPPLVAVVTPVYNDARYLSQAIASVQAQTYPNVVHVVLDNASTDATPRIIEASRGGRVPLLTRRNETHLPLIDNWNAAMAMVPAEARYVHLLCSDDLIRADAVERLVDLCERWPDVRYAVARCVFEGWIFDTGFVGEAGVLSGVEFERWLYSRGEYYLSFAHLFLRADPVLHQAPFRASIMPLSDTDLALRLARGGRVAWTNETLFFNRPHEGSETSRQGGKSAFIVPYLELLLSRGPEIMTPAELERSKRLILHRIHRQLLADRLRGRRDNYNRMMRRLEGLGIKPSALMDVEAVTRRAWLALARRIGLAERRSFIVDPKRLSEDEFLGLYTAGKHHPTPSPAGQGHPVLANREPRSAA